MGVISQHSGLRRSPRSRIMVPTLNYYNCLTHRYNFTDSSTMTEVTTVGLPAFNALFNAFGLKFVTFIFLHGLSVGDTFAIEGAPVTAWNRNLTVTIVVSAFQVVVNKGGADDVSGTGTAKKITSTNLGKRWDNLSGHPIYGNDYVEAANALTNGPTFPGATQINGFDVLDILLGWQGLNLDFASPDIPVPWTIISIHRRNLGAAHGRRIYSTPVDGGAGVNSFTFFGVRVWSWGNGNTTDFFYGTDPEIELDINVPAGGTDRVVFNTVGDVVLSQVDAGNSSLSGFTIGADVSLTQPLDGAHAEFMVFCKALTPMEIRDVLQTFGEVYDIGV